MLRRSEGSKERKKVVKWLRRLERARTEFKEKVGKLRKLMAANTGTEIKFKQKNKRE